LISERQIQERESRKARILDGALNVFQKQGIEKATMDEIAREAGFGKATLYYYYSSKEEIFSSILEAGWTKIWERIEPAIHDHNNSKKTFLKLLTIIAKLVNENRVLYEFLFSAPHSMPEMLNPKQPWKNYQNRMYSVLQGLIEDGISENQFPNVEPKLLLKGLGGLFHGVLFLGNQNEPITNAAIEKFFTQFLGTMSTE
jgi:AcrR family transcriptional regulator